MFYSNIVHKKYCFWDIWLLSIQWPWNPGYGSFKVIKTDTYRPATYDFLLTFHSNHGTISYHFWDKRRFQSKIAKFFRSILTILEPARGLASNDRPTGCHPGYDKWFLPPQHPMWMHLLKRQVLQQRWKYLRKWANTGDTTLFAKLGSSHMVIWAIMYYLSKWTFTEIILSAVYYNDHEGSVLYQLMSIVYCHVMQCFNSVLHDSGE